MSIIECFLGADVKQAFSTKLKSGVELTLVKSGLMSFISEEGKRLVPQAKAYARLKTSGFMSGWEAALGTGSISSDVIDGDVKFTVYMDPFDSSTNITGLEYVLHVAPEELRKEHGLSIHKESVKIDGDDYIVDIELTNFKLVMANNMINMINVLNMLRARLVHHGLVISKMRDAAHYSLSNDMRQDFLSAQDCMAKLDAFTTLNPLNLNFKDK